MMFGHKLSGSLVLALLCNVGFGQQQGLEQGLELRFEVASVKISGQLSGRGSAVPGGTESPDPTLARYINVTFKTLLRNAYNVRDFQIIGPGWLDSERYDIVARVPKGATRKQVSVMLQNLLAERLGLTVHHEMRDLPVYELTVSKSGPRFKRSPVQSIGSKSADGDITFDKDGLPVLPMGKPNIVTMMISGHLHLAAREIGIDVLTETLRNQLRTPVIDLTGLTGRYDFTLDFTPSQAGASALEASDAADNAPDLVSAMREQLGLKLEQRKSPLGVIVIDKAQKTPTPN